MSTFHVNDDGSVAFVTGGSLDPAAAAFSAFQVRDHVGVVDTRDAGSWSYHAIPVPADTPQGERARAHSPA